jgi:hypothetical protein
MLGTHRELFTNYTTNDFGVVNMENNDRAKNTIGGYAHLKTGNGVTLVLKSGRHVEALLVNIILDGFLDGDGYLSIFRNTQYKITKENLIVSEDKMASILYHIHAKLL